MTIRELKKRVRYWGASSIDGGLMTVLVRVPKGYDLDLVAGAYACDGAGPGCYFAQVLSVRRVKRNEVRVEVRFGWDC